jgi:KaiC/GvpD/RAD55 family RecA-like ATPase
VDTTMLTSLEENTVGPGLEKAPTGIRGLDQITGGGLPQGRVSLVAGAAGAGKTLLGLEFLVGGARKCGEPGVLVLKSRGTAHSNQVREFVLTDHGVELAEVYVGPAGMLAGSARLAQQAVERDADLRRADDLERHVRDLRSSISERQAHLIAARDQLIAEQTEIDRIDRRERAARSPTPRRTG